MYMHDMIILPVFFFI